MTIPQIDAQRLKTQQYHSAANLSARIRLHEDFSTNPQDFHRWCFDHLLKHVPEEAQVLEVGSGRGDFWRKNADRIPAGWQITLTDFSAGMLADCRQHLDEPLSGRIAYDIVDAQAIPYGHERFDAVIANHMLYHVPDRRRALAEIRRVLKPGGALLATTIGQNHMRELMQLSETYIPALAAERDDYGFIIGNFSLENGAAQLESYFSQVTLRRFECNLFVTEAQPIMEYVGSMTASLPDQTTIHRQSAALRAEIETRIAAEGGFHITKDTGLFIAAGA